MFYTKKKYKPVEVVDINTGLLMRSRDLKNKAYKVVNEYNYEERRFDTIWIGTIREVIIIAEQQQFIF